MKYKLIVFDIDGTITTHLSSWRYIHERLNIWSNIAYRYQRQFLAGKISYRKFCELDAAHWKGIPEKKIRLIFKKVSYAKNAAASMRRLKKSGFKLVAISTGLQFMTDRIREDLGFDYVLSNRLLTRGGKLTGRVKINIPHDGKGRIIHDICKRFRVTPAEIITVGDSDGDVPLARLSGYSIAFNSSSKCLSKIVDYNCRTKDFSEVRNQILFASLKKIRNENKYSSATRLRP